MLNYSLRVVFYFFVKKNDYHLLSIHKHGSLSLLLCINIWYRNRLYNKLMPEMHPVLYNRIIEYNNILIPCGNIRPNQYYVIIFSSKPSASFQNRDCMFNQD
jgi:hypothetical protein